MEKVIRDGNVAVLYSPGFGTGWWTWNADHIELLFHPKLIGMVESDRRDEITTEWIKDNLGIRNVYTGGAEKLVIAWLPEGTHFWLEDYEGDENIITSKELLTC